MFSKMFYQHVRVYIFEIFTAYYFVMHSAAEIAKLKIGIYVFNNHNIKPVNYVIKQFAPK